MQSVPSCSNGILPLTEMLWLWQGTVLGDSLPNWWRSLPVVYLEIHLQGHRAGLESTGFLHSLTSLDNLTVRNFTHVYHNLPTRHDYFVKDCRQYIPKHIITLLC